MEFCWIPSSFLHWIPAELITVLLKRMSHEKLSGVKSGIIQKLFLMAGDTNHKTFILLKVHFTILKKVQPIYGWAMVYCLDNSRCSLNLCPCNIALRYSHVTLILYDVIVGLLIFNIPQLICNEILKKSLKNFCILEIGCTAAQSQNMVTYLHRYTIEASWYGLCG